MKRLGWGLIGSALIVAFNVSATVAPSCGIAGDDLRCIGTGITGQSGSIQSSTSSVANRKGVSKNDNSDSLTVMPLYAEAPSPTSTEVIDNDSYDDGCE